VITALRSEVVKTLGGRDPKIDVFEIYFTEILAPAGVR